MPLRLFLIAPSALLTDHRPHGDGLVAFGFIRELAARGHELHVAAGRVALRDSLPANVHVHALVDDQDPGPVARPRFMWRLRRMYRTIAHSARFDLVHQLNPGDVGVSLALVDVRVPVVLGPYVPDWAASGPGANTLMSAGAVRGKQLLRAMQQRRATTVLLSTPAAASKLEVRALRPLHVHELSPGIDQRIWLPGHGGNGQDVLFLASLEVRKGIHVALDAFARLAPRLAAARLRVAGSGPESERVRHRIRTTPALDRVELLGPLERESVRTTMQACDVYCLPSYGEPFGMTALEAMACARPVVATNGGGLRHLVTNLGGRTVRAGDAAGLAGALEDLLVDPVLRRAMGEHNRRVVEERYAWSRVTDRLEDLYREAIREPRRRKS